MKILTTERYKKTAAPIGAPVSPPANTPIQPAPGDESEIVEQTSIRGQNIDSKELMNRLNELLKTNNNNLKFLNDTKDYLEKISNKMQTWFELLMQYERIYRPRDMEEQNQLIKQRMWMKNIHDVDINGLRNNVIQQQQKMEESINAVQTTTMEIQESG
jgi:hypothetical protein